MSHRDIPLSYVTSPHNNKAPTRLIRVGALVLRGGLTGAAVCPPKRVVSGYPNLPET
jgi:hypothetical protein